MTTAAIAQFIRHIPVSALKTCLDSYIPLLAVNLNWPEETSKINSLLKAVVRMDRSTHEDMHVLAERINAMASEEGQTALNCSVKNRDHLQKMQNSYERAAWALAHEPASFRQAEEICYADTNRLGQMWDSFIGIKGKAISKDAHTLKKFRSRLNRIFQNADFKIEVYHRRRLETNKQEVFIYQVSIYVESFSESYLELEKGKIVTKTRKPLQEIAICYEPDSGHIEIIATGKELREKVAAAFSETFLGNYLIDGNVPMNEYNLSSLLNQRPFPTDINDGIENIAVLMVKLRAINGDGTLTIEIPAKHNRSIYDQAYEWFAESSPFLGGFVIQSAKLALQFYPQENEGRAIVLPIKINLPNRCDLNSRTEKKRVIGEKYLERWGLRRNKLHSF